MRALYITIFVIAAILLIAISRKEKYWMSTYVMTPQRSGVYPTDVTDYYWWDRYIRQPYVRYAAVPYGWGHGAYPRRRRWRRRWNRHW